MAVESPAPDPRPEDYDEVAVWARHLRPDHPDFERHASPEEDYHEASSLYAALWGSSANTEPGSRIGPGALAFRDDFDPDRRLGLPTSFTVLDDAVRLAPAQPIAGSLHECLLGRRSATTADARRDLEQAELSALLAYGCGARNERAFAATGRATSSRCAPSGGALYPLDTLVLATGCRDLPRTLYGYHPYEHALAPLRADPDAVVAGVSDPDRVLHASLTLVLAVNLWRSRVKYGSRAYRYALLEAGHVAQNAALVATALGLGTLTWAGFFDRAFNQALGLDGTERFAVYLVTVDAR